MSVIESKISVAEPTSPTRLLDSAQVVTGQGTTDREGVFIGDPQDPAARAEVSRGGALSVSSSQDRVQNLLLLANAQMQAAASGFVPIELPSFLIGG